MVKYGTRYEREVYHFLEFFGQVGGFLEVLTLFCTFVVHILCSNLIDAKTVSTFLHYTFEDGCDDDDN